MDTFYTNLNLVPAKHITVVFDACFSGKSVGGDLITEVSGLIIPELKVGNFNDKTNHVILTSSDGDQFSNWYSEKRHGLFTYFFLKGLRGEADLNSDLQIVVHELFSYMTENVLYHAKMKPQVPKVNGKTDWVITRLSKLTNELV